MKRTTAGVLLLAILAVSRASGQSSHKETTGAPRPDAPAGADLEAGFRDPPPEARARCFWWWLNGNVTKEAITRDLEEMKKKGLGGALIFDAGGAEQRGNSPVPAGPTFGSSPWRELFRHAVQEADRLGLKLSLNIQSGWNLGGPDVSPEEAAKQLTWFEIELAGPGRFDGPLPAPPSRDGYYRDVVVLAYRLRPEVGSARRPIRDLAAKAMTREVDNSAPDCRFLLTDVPPKPGEKDVEPADVLPLSERLDPQGRLAWDVPEGRWVVLRLGYTLTKAHVSTGSGAWQGHVIDYLSASALRAYWDRNVGPLLDDLGSPVPTALEYLHTDSWECGGMNWTPGFEREFRARRGYDPIPYLLVLVGKIVGSRQESNSFLADFRKTLGDCVVENHYQVLAELAHRRGLGIHPESGGPRAGPIDALKNLGRGDLVMSEFWVPSPPRAEPRQRLFVKQAGSAAKIYNRRIVAAEAFTSIGPHWDDVLWSAQKPTFDHEACAGLNLCFIHTFTCSPKEMGLPGQEYFAGTHFNPNVTWWDQAGAFVAYLNRCQFLLQQGPSVADVCYYAGDHVPNLTQRKEADPAKVLPGFDYDVLNEEVLLRAVGVRDGRLVLPHGAGYRVLVLPDHGVLSLSALGKVHRLVEQGATVVGRKPQCTMSLTGLPESEEQFHRLAESLWPASAERACEHRLGQGRVIWAKTTREVLIESGVPPDVEFAGSLEGVFDYIHRAARGIDIYFLSNQRPAAESVRCAFRVAGRQPELWDAVSGSIRPAKAFWQADGRTTVPLEMPPCGSIFVVFRRPIPPDAQGDRERNTPTLGPPWEIAGPWTVSFDPNRGGPPSLEFDRLVNWTQRPEPEVRFYSGTAVYRKTFDLPPALVGPNRRVILDLGEVREMARVRLNGRDLGVLWTRPAQIVVTGFVRAERNELEIEVVNTWRNRLVGDRGLPPEARRTRTNITIQPQWEPLPSGLLGPVRLHAVGGP